jgi:hypothetical protein
VEGDEMIR